MFFFLKYVVIAFRSKGLGYYFFRNEEYKFAWKI